MKNIKQKAKEYLKSIETKDVMSTAKINGIAKIYNLSEIISDFATEILNSKIGVSDDEIDKEIRMIWTHAFIGTDWDDNQAFELAIKGTKMFCKKLMVNPDQDCNDVRGDSVTDYTKWHNEAKEVLKSFMGQKFKKFEKDQFDIADVMVMFAQKKLKKGVGLGVRLEREYNRINEDWIRVEDEPIPIHEYIWVYFEEDEIYHGMTTDNLVLESGIGNIGLKGAKYWQKFIIPKPPKQ